jgi:exodeoxyribonuclease VII small subunit
MSQDQNHTQNTAHLSEQTNTTQPQEGSTPQGASFEQTLGQLQDVVQRLNQADLPLDEALEIYDRGVQLARHGRTLLSRAEQRVSHLRGALGGGDEPSP